MNSISKQSRLEKTLSNSISMIEYYIIKKPISFVNDIFNEYNDLKDVYDENRILKEKLDSYVNIESENEVLQSEIKKLKKLTEMDYLPICLITYLYTSCLRFIIIWKIIHFC